jgi:hypothetical protein
MTGFNVSGAPGPAFAAGNPFLTTEFFLSVGLLASVLLGGAVVFFFVDRWRKRQLSPGRETTDTLSTFRMMFERGELTEAEYRKVRDRVAARMREEVAPPAARAGESAPPPEARGTEPPTENPSG